MSAISMTGFGEGHAQTDLVQISVEIKSVNHRFLDVVPRLPSIYLRFETDIVKKVRSVVKRGRIELYVNRKELSEPGLEVQFHPIVFRSYLKAVKKAFAVAGISSRDALGLSVVNMLNKREVIELIPKETHADKEYGALESALSIALDNLVKMRSVEGGELAKELLCLIDSLEKNLEELSQKVQQTPQDYKQKLTQRLERLSLELPVEPERLAQEIAIFADRIDVTDIKISMLESFVRHID